MIMKRLAGAALIAALVGQPALAAELGSTPDRDLGYFGGVRLRLPLDGRRGEPLRAGLAIAPLVQTRSMQGEVRTRIGEGVEFGVAGREPLRLSIGGVPANRLVPGRSGPNGSRQGVSTLGWVGIGAGAVVVTLGITYVLFMEWIDCDADEECS
jgi:hypothetical protein